jgi:transcriptional repressor NrdR
VCGRRFSTFESAERPRLWVIKRDGTREEFSREKCLASMRIACRKRNVPMERLEDAADRVERDLLRDFEEEAPSWAVGDLAMKELRLLDTVAYIRFSSVYREFQSVQDFLDVVEDAHLPPFDQRQPALEV